MYRALFSHAYTTATRRITCEGTFLRDQALTYMVAVSKRPPVTKLNANTREAPPELTGTLPKNVDLFDQTKPELLKKYASHLTLKPQTALRFWKAGTVTCSLGQSCELRRLQQEGTTEPVQYSDWASPIVSA